MYMSLKNDIDINTKKLVELSILQSNNVVILIFNSLSDKFFTLIVQVLIFIIITNVIELECLLVRFI